MLSNFDQYRIGPLMTEHRLEFTISENPWAPTAVVAEINERYGCGLELIGLSEQAGGVSSAAFARWPDGREAAITKSTASVGRMRQSAEAVGIAAAAGIPVPRHDLVVELADGTVTVVQERLPGRHATHVDAGTVDAMVAMNDRFADLLIDRPDVPLPAAFPARELDRNPWEETLGHYNDRTRRLLRQIHDLDGELLYEMTGNDLVHTDYSFGNVLFDERGQISGVVDWNFGAERGDRRFALLCMRDHLENEGDQYEGCHKALDRVDQVLTRRLGPALLRTYSAHRALHGLHTSIKRFSHRPERIENGIRAAERYLA